MPNAAWTRLRVSLRLLKDSSTTLAPLPFAIEILLSSLDGFENLVKGWPNYEELASSLEILSDSIVQLIQESQSILMPNAVSSLVFSVQQQVVTLRAEIEHEANQRVLSADPSSNDLVACYRSVQSLFRQLKVNLQDSIWSFSMEGAIATLLEGLNAAKIPAHSSGIPADFQRTCTEGTRVGVLGQLDEWLQDPMIASVCWVSGTEGTGKTTIASTFCKQLEDRKLLVARFFGTRVASEYKGATCLWSMIACQLAQYSAPFLRALCDVLTKDPEIASKDEAEQFRRMVLEPLARARAAMPENMVVLIDGLEEHEDFNGAALVRDLLVQHTGEAPLRFLVTSRRKLELSEGLAYHGQPFVTVHLDDIDQSLVRSDIERYFQAELRSMALTTAQLGRLADHTNKLFLCAAVIARFIQLDHPRSNSYQRLELVLSMTHESTRKHAYIDMVYTAILRSVLNEDVAEDGERDVTQVVLWTVLFAQEAISIETISTLGGIDDLQRVKFALQPLSPVLYYSEVNGLILVMHASFPEFMMNSERSGAFFYDIAKHSRFLTERCFRVMKTELRFNICGLESPFVPDRDVGNIEDRIKEKISPTLLYACRHWANHLELAAVCDILVRDLEEFLCSRLLFWMEVLSLRRELRFGVVGFVKTKKWLEFVSSASFEVVLLVDDAYDFVTTYAANPVSQSTPHIYISSLPFCLRTSKVYEHYSKLTVGLLDIHDSLTREREAAALAVWTAHSGVKKVTYSPDGARIAFTCSDGSVNILDAYDGTPLRGLSEDYEANSVAFSPDGSKFATTSWNGTVQLWSAVDETPVTDPFLGHTEGAGPIAFSPDGILIASGASDRTVRVWKANDGTAVAGPFETGRGSPVAFSPDSSCIAITSTDNRVLLWDLDVPSSPILTLAARSYPVSTLAFSPDGSQLISGSLHGYIHIWNLSNGTLTRVIDCFTKPTPKALRGRPVNSDILSIAISPNGRRIVSGSSDWTVRVWNIDDGALVAGPFFGHSYHVDSVSYSPDGTRVVSCSWDRSIRVWSVREDLSYPALDRQMFEITSIMFSPSESRIYTTSPCGVSIWDVNNGSLITKITSSRPQSRCSLLLSRDGTQIAVFLDDNSVEVLSTKDRSRIAGPFRGHTEVATCAAFSFYGTYLVTGSKDCTIRVWNLQNEQLVAVPFVGHTGEVMRVSISRDGTRLISCSLDGSIRMWKVHTSRWTLGAGGEVLGSSSGSASSNGQPGMLNGWISHRDGWVTTADGSLLFWVPLDLPRRLTPGTELVITRSGSFCVPKHELLLGAAWTGCYIDH